MSRSSSNTILRVPASAIICAEELAAELLSQLLRRAPGLFRPHAAEVLLFDDEAVRRAERGPQGAIMCLKTRPQCVIAPDDLPYGGGHIRRAVPKTARHPDVEGDRLAFPRAAGKLAPHLLRHGRPQGSTERRRILQGTRGIAAG